jgi:hypothetical protein
MRPVRIVLWVGGLVAFAAGAGRADAAWNNAFQVCCLGCKSAPSTANYVAAYPSDPCCPQPCPPPPCQVCETRYVQRTYYCPETHYETQTRYEPVTTYSKSYYWEPVQSYRVSCYYDPCTCSYKQVACPVTSYRLREQCCPVQSWVARCYSVPVTTMKPYTRCEPVTSCYWTNAAAQAAPYAPTQGAAVQDNRPPASAGQGVNDTGSYPGSESQKPYAPQGYRQYTPPASPAPKAATPVRPDTFVQAPPAVRLDTIAPLPSANVEGVVLRSDDRPDAGARLTFKRADREGVTHTVTADGAGRFKATLASGGWVVCTQRADGQLVPQTRIDVREDKSSEIKLTSR